MSYNLRLECFEGPFDLLLHLIDKNEMDIYNIKIAEITNQYIEYLTQMEEMDLEVASEFIIMASRLLLLKTKMLLPKPLEDTVYDEVDENDGEDKLIADILEYKRIKNAALIFAEMKQERSEHFVRPNEEALFSDFFSKKNPLEGKTLDDLSFAFKRLYEKAQKDSLIFAIKKEEITIDQMMTRIESRVIASPEGIDFNTLFAEIHTKYQVIIAFLALLELMKVKKVAVSQIDNFGVIHIFPVLVQ